MGYYLTPESPLWDICRSFLTDFYKAKEVLHLEGSSCICLVAWPLWRQRCWWITEEGCSVLIIITLYPVWPNCPLDWIHYSPPQSLFVNWPKCVFFWTYCNKEHFKWSSIRERSADFDKQHFPSHIQFAKGHFKGAAYQGALTKNQLKEWKRAVNSLSSV